MNPVSAWGHHAALVVEALQTRSRLDAVERQIATGKNAQTFGELGHLAGLSIDARAALGHVDAFEAAIDRTRPRVETTQAILNRLMDIAQTGLDRVHQQFGVFPPPLSVVAAEAGKLLEEIRGLLNTAVDGDLLFNGTATQANGIPNWAPTIPQPIAASGMFAGIQAQMTGLSPGSANAVIAATLALAASNAPGVTPFSAWLSSPAGLAEARLSVRVDVALDIAWGFKANQNAVAVSAPPTTGAAIRDLIWGISILAAADETQRANAPQDFADVLQAVRAGLSSARAALAEEAGHLGTVQNRLDALKRHHETSRILLEKQIASVEDADLAALATRRSLLQTQLEASFRVLAALRELTLARFLG